MVKQVNASHILLNTETNANLAKYEITHGKTFEEVAKNLSKCPSGKKGGKLGWFSRGQMVKEFEKAAFTMKKGELSDPVKTQFGWHIILVNDTK